MTEYRFVQIIIVVILGLGLTEILRNLGGQVRRRSRIEVYPLQVFASGFLLFSILMWHWSFSQKLEVTWTLPIFILKVIPTIALALGAQVIGIDFDSSKSAKQQYFENCGLLYFILASAPIIAVFTTKFTYESLLTTGGTLTVYNILRLVTAGVLVSLAFIKKPSYHWIALIFSFALVTGSTSVVLFKLKF